MTSNRPYLIRALYEWIIDNGMTPHLVVDAEHAAAVVPRAFVDDGRIVLNVAPGAVQALQLGNDGIRFSARFGGSPFAVSLPPQAVLGIYSRENGQGMLFPDEEPATEDESNTDPTDDGGGDKKPNRPSLRVIK
ncbi:MAG: ClpXP protease specificity-enhancing factor [Thiohalocapsa sp.]